MGRTSLAALVAAALLSATPSIGQAAEGSAVASEMNGFGRLIITLDKPVKAVARSSNGILVIEFEEAVRIDHTKLPIEAPEYIAVSRHDPDRRTLRFALTQPFKVDLKEAGEKLFIDLLPESWQGLAPGLPSDVVAELARRALAAEEAQRQAKQKQAVETERPLGVSVCDGSDLQPHRFRY